MKTPWKRSEKWLWGTPLLFGVIAFALTRGPNFTRRVMGWPQQLDTPLTNSLQIVVLSRDGSVIAATGRDDEKKISPASGTVYLWDAHTLQPLKSFAPQLWRTKYGWSAGWIMYGMSLSPDGKFIGMGNRGAPGYSLYEVITQKLLWHVATRAQHSQFSADGRFIALAQMGTEQFELREVLTGKLVTRWKASNGSMISHFALSPDAKTVAWINKRTTRTPTPIPNNETAEAPNGQAVEIRRLSDGKILRLLANSQETEAVAFSPDGTQIVSLALGELTSGAIDGSTVRLHSSGGKLLWQRDFRRSTQKQEGYRLFCDAIFSPDGKTIALCDATPEGRLLLLNASDGTTQKQLTPAKGQNTNYLAPPALAFSPDGKQLFARGKNSVLVWDLE